MNISKDEVLEEFKGIKVEYLRVISSLEFKGVGAEGVCKASFGEPPTICLLED
ncbi:Hypothetical protein IALB_1231 [Ignavibacterium album JCM 16511]|uniref:Uncharacterized protein n=1 Tax=Ignavibacterium album (strain DSM 19864 / JCM 16511 / NBRC 101810 / Mat9-16) TaxID=945713 RepID=I0AIY5_IGNAJ|nr:Hypothetical protein IALB_1231 [Ignavibacterium album JCM 16511]